MLTFVMFEPVTSGVYVPSATSRCSSVPEGNELPNSSVKTPSPPYWPFSIFVFTSSSVNESRRANSSLPVLPMVSRASSVFVRPGSCTRIWSVPCTCTTDSEAPSAFTRLSMMARDFSMSSLDTACPSSPFAVSTTDRPPWMSSPWLIRSCGGVNRNTDPMMSRVVMTKSHTLRRLALRAGFFFDFWAVAMEVLPRVLFAVRSGPARRVRPEAEPPYYATSVNGVKREASVPPPPPQTHAGHAGRDRGTGIMSRSAMHSNFAKHS